MWHYFVQRGTDKFKHNIFRVKTPALIAECITDRRLNFEECHGSVSLGHELYCYFKDGKFFEISNNKRTVKSLARPSYRGYGSALTAYKRNHLFLLGGQDSSGKLGTVEVYNVDFDLWRWCSELNSARVDHSCCILGDMLYVSGGSRGEDSIEVASCTDLIGNNSATW